MLRTVLENVMSEQHFADFDESLSKRRLTHFQLSLLQIHLHQHQLRIEGTMKKVEIPEQNETILDSGAKM